MLIVGNEIYIPPAAHDRAAWVDKTIREFIASHPHYSVEQAAIMLCIALTKLKEDSPEPVQSQVENDVLSALVNMKCKQTDAAAAVQKAKEEVGIDTFDELFSRAIRFIKPTKG